MTSTEGTKKKRLPLYLSPKLYHKLEEAARQDNRSMNNMATWIMEQFFANTGEPTQPGA